MGAGGNGERLPPGFFGETGRTCVGDPYLDRPQALLAEPGAVPAHLFDTGLPGRLHGSCSFRVTRNLMHGRPPGKGLRISRRVGRPGQGVALVLDFGLHEPGVGGISAPPWFNPAGRLFLRSGPSRPRTMRATASTMR